MSQRDDTYLKQLQVRYRKASKQEKTVILDEYVKTTGYPPHHIITARYRRYAYYPDNSWGDAVLRQTIADEDQVLPGVGRPTQRDPVWCGPFSVVRVSSLAGCRHVFSPRGLSLCLVMNATL